MKTLIILFMLMMAGCSSFLPRSDNSLLTEQIKTLTIERDELKSNKIVGLDSQLKYLITGSIIGMGLFAGLIFFGQIKGGTFGLIGSATIFILSLTAGIHSAALSWLGLALIVFAIGLVVYRIIMDQRSIQELIQSTQKVKDNISEDDKKKIFGDKGLIRDIQSDRTTKIVKKITK